MPKSKVETEWSPFAIRDQIRTLAQRVIEERYSQEDRWGPQNVHDLQHADDGRKVTGKPYRVWEKIFKHQCDLARQEGRESLDLILQEEVYEALAKAVELADSLTESGRRAAREELIEELLQVAAVAIKWAGITERNEVRHG